MGARRGGARGALVPLEFEKMTSYAAVLQNTLKFSLAPSVLAIDTLYFSLKHRKNAHIFVGALGAPKTGRFFVRRPKTDQLFQVVVVSPPLEKISASAHECIHQ